MLTVGRPGRRLVLAVAAMLALTCQSLVVQTHVHSPGEASPSSSVRAQPAPGHERAPDKDRAACPICHEGTQAGHYLLPLAPAFAPPAALFLAVAALAYRSPWRSIRRRAWRNRGPPPIVPHR